MIDIQALLDGISHKNQRERSKTQMTLGGMISVLKKMTEDLLIDGIEEPHSYRGYYEDLSFEPTEDKVKAGKTLSMCREAMGKVFEGYKGGDFVMGELTPVWVAKYGDCGRKIIDINSDGNLITEEDD